MKELVETRFWFRLSVRRGWMPESRLGPLMVELEEIKKIVGSLLTKTKATANLRTAKKSTTVLAAAVSGIKI